MRAVRNRPDCQRFGAAVLACFMFALTLIIVRRPAGSIGFFVQPRRWVGG